MNTDKKESADKIVGSTDGLGVSEPRDTEGPQGTYGCACLSHDAKMCTFLRYGMDADDPCECLCHNWREQDDEDVTPNSHIDRHLPK